MIHLRDGTLNYTCELPLVYYIILLTQHHSPFLDNSCKITISVLHDSTLGNKCLGTADIDIEQLLKLQNEQMNEGEHYHIVD